MSELSVKEQGIRLKEIRKELGLSQRSISSSIELSQPAWGKAETGMGRLKPANLKKLEVKYNVNVRYIRYGEGKRFREATKQKNNNFINVIKGSALASLSEKLPLHDFTIEKSILLPGVEDEELLAIEVEGKSMEPLIQEGSIVVIRRMKDKSEFVNSKPYVIIVEGIAFLKRVEMVIGGNDTGKFQIKSDNEEKIQLVSGDEITSWFKVTHVINTF